MWADNETRIDLLGFDYLVDSLEVVLTEPRLLPVTVGVLGDWGSGKSSLLNMVADRLTPSGQYVVVPFSPWRYEAYEDVKAALMEAVLSSLESRIPKAADPEKAAGLMSRLRHKVIRLRPVGCSPRRRVPWLRLTKAFPRSWARLPAMRW